MLGKYMLEKTPVYCAFISNKDILTSDLVFFATAALATQHAKAKTWSIEGKIDVRTFVAAKPSEEAEEKLSSGEGVEYGLLFFSLADLIATEPNFHIYVANHDAEDDPDRM